MRVLTKLPRGQAQELSLPRWDLICSQWDGAYQHLSWSKKNVKLHLGISQTNRPRDPQAFPEAMLPGRETNEVPLPFIPIFPILAARQLMGSPCLDNLR